MAVVDPEAMTNGHAGRHEWVRRTRVAVFVALATVLAAPALSWGHPGPAPASLGEVAAPGNLLFSPPVAVGFWLLSLTAALVLASTLGLTWFIWPRRKVTILALTILLSVSAFETAVHSVHHLLDWEKAAKCVIFGASQHLSGTPTDSANIETPVLTVVGSSSTHTDPGLPSRSLRPDQGRGPPSPTAA